MENKSIKELLNGLYEGTLTEEQEKELIDYFSEEKIDDEFKEEKETIDFLSSKAEIQIPESLESRLDSIIQTDILSKYNFKRWLAISSVAACLLIIIGIGVALKEGKKKERNMVAMTEEERIKMAQEKLVYVSTKFNEGLNSFVAMETQINKVDKLLNRKK